MTGSSLVVNVCPAWTEDELKIQTIHKLNPEKKTMQNTAKQNYPGLVASYYTRPGNEMNFSSVHTAHDIARCRTLSCVKALRTERQSARVSKITNDGCCPMSCAVWTPLFYRQLSRVHTGRYITWLLFHIRLPRWRPSPGRKRDDKECYYYLYRTDL